MKIRPARGLRGNISLPGDKSISHRAAMIGALAAAPSAPVRITNFSTGADCATTLQCLKQLGVSIHRDRNNVVISGAGSEHPWRLQAPTGALDCGNSGSTIRMLAGILAGQDFDSTLTGDDSLRTRPMKRVIEPLELMGAHIESQDGRPPLRIKNRREPLKGINYRMPVVSAQVKSCLLLAGLGAAGRTEIIEQLAVTRDHTERMLRWFGFPVETRTEKSGTATSHIISVEGSVDRQLVARDLTVPGDISSAVFFIAGAVLLPDSGLEISGVGLNPTRTQFLKTLRELGADLSLNNLREECLEPRGDIHVRGSSLFPTEKNRTILRGSVVSGLIDELPMLAVIATQVEGGIEVRDAAELRVKESDRISTVTENLRRMGAEVEEYADGFAVMGPTKLSGARLDAYGDHRIAMAFTIAALIAEGESEITGAECASVSFPEFFEILESVIER